MPAPPSAAPTASLPRGEPWKLLLAAFGAGAAFACVALAGTTWAALQLLHPA